MAIVSFLCPYHKKPSENMSCVVQSLITARCNSTQIAFSTLYNTKVITSKSSKIQEEFQLCITSQKHPILSVTPALSN